MNSALASAIAVGGTSKPFGELTVDEVRAHAAALGEATGFGHRSRVGAVAAAWREFARLMDERGAERVEDVSADLLETFAERLWVIPPGGSLLP